MRKNTREIHGEEHYALLSLDTWKDFEAMFEKHHGVRGGCWCVYHLVPSSVYAKMTKEERKAYLYAQVKKGISTGILYYLGQTPIGWCEFGRPEIFGQINHGRDYNKLNLFETINPNWRISCQFVDKDYRRLGFQRKVLNAALECMVNLGGGVVEAYPIDIPEIDTPQYSGTVKLYKEAGFQVVSRLGKDRLLMTKTI
jgi:ribosomal protein S18 acetylase RimI-like enzyme